MLDFREFKSEFIASCKNDIESLTDIFGCEDIEIEERSVTKAQYGNLTGLIFRAPDTVAAPTYYVEDFYGMYRDGVPIARLSLDAAHSAFHFIHEAPPFPGAETAECFENPANLRVRLINKARNSALLETVPYMDAGCGLALIPEVRSGDFRAVVTHSLAKSFNRNLNIDESELVSFALTMTAANEAAVLADLSEMLLHGQDNCENLLSCPRSELLPPPDSLYVLSNKSFFWGASALFYPGISRRLSYLFGGDFYVLPSSVHEVLLLPVSMGDPDRLIETIHEGNRTVVGDEDFLSDDLIICEDGQLRTVTPSAPFSGSCGLPC